jgi:hypothetical protein
MKTEDVAKIVEDDIRSMKQRARFIFSFVWVTFLL